VAVRAITPQTSDEMIKLYFENLKKSGGGEVVDVDRKTAEGVVYVTFKNAKGTFDFQ
jgi:hypothetical protein